jgi:hypothetical protein
MRQEDPIYRRLLINSQHLTYGLWMVFLLSCALLLDMHHWHTLSPLQFILAQLVLLDLSGLLLILQKRNFISMTRWQGFEPQRQSGIEIQETATARINELKLMTHAALKSAAKANEKFHAAQRATKHKSEFLATMSHEIRTPMNGVLGMTELLRETELTSQQQHYLDTICTSGMTLLTIIDDLLDYSKLEAGKLSIENIGFNLHRLIDQCGDMFALNSAQKRLPLLILAPTNIPETLYGDPTRIRQILVNLLGNAFKFTEQGAIHLSITIDEPDTDRPDDSISITFSILDTGIGMTQKQIDQLFQAFQQADHHISRQYGGTGLGLAICKRLVNLMQGEIGVRSDASFNSEFWFRLPLGIQAPPQYLLDPKRLANQRCSIVSDDPYLISQLQHLLHSWGAEIQVHSLTNAMKKPPKLDALMLIDCPPDQGSEILTWIAPVTHQKILLLGYAGTLPSTHDFTRVGISASLEKPISPLALYQCLEQLLQNAALLEPIPTSTAHFHLQFNNLKILVAEDNLVNQIVVRGMLSKLGITPIFASNGDEAFALFSQAEAAFDLIFMDCEMPELDGLGATEKIRSYEQQQQLNRTPIVALSAHAMDEHIQHCLLAGMDKHISKPVNLDVIKQCLLNYFPGHVQPNAFTLPASSPEYVMSANPKASDA